MKNFDAYKFRCSALGNLMTDARGGITEKQLALIQELQRKATTPKGITEKQEETLMELMAKRDAPPELSETTKKYLRQVWIKETYGRERDIQTKEMEKGLRQEEVSLTMVTDYYSEKLGKKVILIKNKEELSNDWITGTPDITDPFLLDIKSAWDLFTFPMFETKCPDEGYYWQLGVGYAWLKDLKDGDITRLIYTLPDVTDYQLVKEKKFSRLYDMNPDSEEYIELEQKIEKNLTFGDMPLAERIKVFELKVKLSDRELLKERISMARAYLNELNNIRFNNL